MNRSFRRTGTAGILVVLGVGFTGWSARMLADAYAVRAWPTAQGVVIRSEVEAATDPTDAATTVYAARVAYVYEVGSSAYTARRVTLAAHSSSRRGEHEGVVERYAVGSSVAVRYDPARPGSGVLEADVPIVLYGPLALGILAMVSGVVAVVRSLA